MREKLTHRWNAILSVILCSFLIGAVLSRAEDTSGDSSDPEDRKSLEEVVLALKWYHQFQFAGYYAAIEQGFYREEGLAVKLTTPENGVFPLESVLNGDAQYGVTSADLVKARAEGKPVVVLGVIFQHSPIILLSRHDANLQFLSDYVGKTVMGSMHDLPEIQAMFTNEGVDPSLINFIDHTWTVDDIINGKVDAAIDYITNEPYQMRIRGVKPRIIRPIDYGIDYYGDALFTSESEIKSYPDRVERFKRASLKGWEYAFDNVDEMIDLIIEMPGVRDRGKTRELLRYEAEEISKLVIPHLVEIGNINPRRYDRMANIYSQFGVISGEFSLDGFVYSPDMFAPDYEKLIKFTIAGTLIALFAASTTLYLNYRLKSEIKKAKVRVKESEAKLSALFGAMTEMVVLHDLVFDATGKAVNYRITDCNEAFTRITGIQREDAIGKLATEAYGTKEPPYMDEFSAVGCTGNPIQYETYFSPMDKYFATSVVSPEKYRFATITADITEVKRVQAIIDAKNKELEQLVYIASHDLRSPLVNVDGYSREIDYSIQDLTTLLDDCSDTKALEKALRAEFPEMIKSISRIRTSAAQMDKLLKGLLHLSRMGRAALNIDDVDMDDCLSRLKESFSFVINEIGIDLHLEKLPPCRGDAVQLTQVFSNLIDNAIKYRHPDRALVITVTGVIEGNRAVYRVIDNGVGIQKNHLDHIFELFHRLEPNKSEGEGLGLTVARQSISRLYGEIQVDSVPGEGSIFVIILPLARSNEWMKG